MSKSYGNTVMLTDPEPVVRLKLKTMSLILLACGATDPGNPDVCPVGDLHKIFSSKETMAKYTRLPLGGNRLHRVQKLGCRCSGKNSQPHAGTPKKIRGQSAPRLGYSGGWLGSGS